MQILLRRASLRTLNQSSVPTLIKRIQKGVGVTATHAQTLLVFVSKHQPALLQPHLGELTKAIADDKNAVLVEAALQALAAVAKWDSTLAPTDKYVQPIILITAS